VSQHPKSVLAVAFLLALACGGDDRPTGQIAGERRSSPGRHAEPAVQRTAGADLERLSGSSRPLPPRQILFGDLHVHTTYSIDAFFFSLPVVGGEGAHPPADACDFARHCAALDFYALTDHAEGITPAHWQAEKESVRECNALAGDPQNPDLVAFTGFEWTQVGSTPETHWGHKNVIFAGGEEGELPARPINSTPDEGVNQLFSGFQLAHWLRWVDPLNWREYADFAWLVGELAATPVCERGVDTRELPTDCAENAATPEVLFEKLAQWGHEVLVIPHGTTWGLYTPPGTSMDKQLNRRQHDPKRQTLIEIMSGHGNSEEYRAFREFEVADSGEKVCPEPTGDYLPCCWRAGEIMRERCGDLPGEECERRVEEAKRLALDANVAPHLVFPDTRGEDWLDCDQCRDCFKPSLGYRPRESVQYSMALSNFEEAGEDGEPLRFRYGFIASSDNHTARPGTGYKQYERRRMTEGTGVRSALYDRLFRSLVARGSDPQMPQPLPEAPQGLFGADTERVASFLYPGGLVAVHSAGRSRQAIWSALERREVYGTSGPRILLWFDLLNGPSGPLPMGSEVTLSDAPRFEARAVGSFVQKPGCPDDSVQALSSQRLERLCRGECYHASDERHPIRAIEIVRVRPQAYPGEDVGPLIEDPWRRFDCEPDPAGCVVRFDDPEHATSGRSALYYARAIQEATPAVNGANLRTQFDAEGQPVRTAPCYGDYRTDFAEDCLAPLSERAWSSPIFVEPSPRAAID
jgi:hypothetical protein